MPTPEIFTMKAGDLSPPLQIQLLTRSVGAPIVLTGFTVAFVMEKINDDNTVTELVNSAATITDAATGMVEYRWSGSDTAVAGTHKGRFIITETATSKPETFPEQGYIDIEIETLP
jgi:hypothetical protein